MMAILRMQYLHTAKKAAAVDGSLAHGKRSSVESPCVHVGLSIDQNFGSAQVRVLRQVP